MLQLFTFQSKNVHCYGTWDNPIWIAQEVCDCLDLQGDAGQHTRRLDEDEKVLISIQTPGGFQEMLGVTEPGLYNLVLGCRKKVAKQFKRWLTHEVIPSIRKTGSYTTTPTEVSEPAPKEIAEAIASVFCLGTIDPGLIQGLIANEIGNAYPQLKPHMEAAKKLLPLPVEQELLTVTDLAKRYVEQTGKSLTKNNTDRGNVIALNKLLIALGLQVKNPDGNPDYLPTEQGKACSKVVLQEGKESNKTCQQLRWYPKVIERLG